MQTERSKLSGGFGHLHGRLVRRSVGLNFDRRYVGATPRCTFHVFNCLMGFLNALTCRAHIFVGFPFNDAVKESGLDSAPN